MWPRQTEPLPDREDELRVESDLRKLLGDGAGNQEPNESYWSGLLVRANQRIDEVASGKAISISWAARVAIPGAIAIIFFYIGLHYYEPDAESQQMSVRELVGMLPPATQDSLTSYLMEEMDAGEFVEVEDISTATHEDAIEYLLRSDRTADVISVLADTELEELMGLMSSGSRL